ncbi:MAG: DUF2358 domain-containing protein [Prochloraceae cyanobacterium]
MDILEILKRDYEQFPENQTYTIYAENVYFKDPLNEFIGVDRYIQNINTIARWFEEIELEVRDLRRVEDTIKSEWTLYMNSPLPWKPRLAIPGRSELKLNAENLIISHIDYWNISPMEVLKQNLFPLKDNNKRK